ncbi:hypothetical protein EWM64_g752 [Hericium alpestre]|uniref:J domain-containing protein n=1 Tax=Hericium alpestre TaxID=135208 RepID=A0A4Z0AB88_9AGAM|nr:hypothetical protein EWM64_g752 [Hericium alpestre]
MALYFIVTVLFIVLVPATLSFSFTSSKPAVPSMCECQPCREQRQRINKREKGSLLHPKFTTRGTLTVLGWILFGLISYKLSNTAIENKVYDPFEILGLKTGVTEKEIKSHFKKLSKLFHPDKVKLSDNDTVESVAAKFVEITKAYKSLTDETIRKNFEDFGHPDGRQTVTMGIALPRWIVEAQNNIWVLGVYGLLFGVSLPALVGRWWFGSRQKTKDGIHAQTAAAFFKALTENSGIEEILRALGSAIERQRVSANGTENELREIEKAVESQLGTRWSDLKPLTEGDDSASKGKLQALILLHAHLLRIPIQDETLRKAQADVLLQTPGLLNALLNISMSRNWFYPTVAIMHLQAYLAQALLPGNDAVRYAQLPGIRNDDIQKLPEDVESLEDFVQSLEKSDTRLQDIKTAVNRWGHLDVVDASFKVIGERIITPSALVFLVVKLRLAPSGNGSQTEPTASVAIAEAQKDEEFLNSPKDVEELASPEDGSGWAHAPYWPANRKPGWWIVLADAKSNRVVVPPMKINDVPFSREGRQRDFRSYKLRFQAPPAVGIFTWRVHFVSDTFLGEDVVQDITLKIDDVSTLTADEQAAEDEISEPEEDTLAGQMAAMRGGSVKKSVQESDDESTTDDDADNASDSSSDSD